MKNDQFFRRNANGACVETNDRGNCSTICFRSDIVLLVRRRAMSSVSVGNHRAMSQGSL